MCRLPFSKRGRKDSLTKLGQQGDNSQPAIVFACATLIQALAMTEHTSADEQVYRPKQTAQLVWTLFFIVCILSPETTKCFFRKLYIEYRVSF